MSLAKQLDAPPTLFKKAIPIVSPVSGQSVSLAHCNDQLVSAGYWGPGAALITPTNKIVSPFSGTIVKVCPLDYAIELTSSFGLKCRIKFGHNTLQLHGEKFHTQLTSGDDIQRGQTLFTLNGAWLKQQGVENICIITILNAQALIGVLPSSQKHIEADVDTLFTLYV